MMNLLHDALRKGRWYLRSKTSASTISMPKDKKKPSSGVVGNVFFLSGVFSSDSTASHRELFLCCFSMNKDFHLTIERQCMNASAIPHSCFGIHILKNMSETPLRG